MTREEAIRILDPETTIEALAEIEYYNGFTGKTAAVQAVSDACEIAVAAMRELEALETEPMTIEDLRAIKEETPIYLSGEGKNHWMIVYGAREKNGKIDLVCAGHYYRISDYGKTLLAYRRKPKEGGVAE